MGSGTMEECFNRMRNREHPYNINIPLFHYSISAINSKALKKCEFSSNGINYATAIQKDLPAYRSSRPFAEIGILLELLLAHTVEFFGYGCKSINDLRIEVFAL